MKAVSMSSKSKRQIIGLSRSFLGCVDVRQEIGMLRAQLEATKFQILQWLFGVLTGAGALGLGSSVDFRANSQPTFDCLVEWLLSELKCKN